MIGWLRKPKRSTSKRVGGLSVARLQRDRDSKYSKAFDKTLHRRRMQVISGAFRSTDTQAYVERFIQSPQMECLDHFVIFGTNGFDLLTKEYLEHCHIEPAH